MARQFDSGVTSYTVAQCELTVYFPEDETKCQWCPLIRHNDGLNRDRCGLTDEIIVSREIRGRKCPLTIINKVKTEDLEE